MSYSRLGEQDQGPIGPSQEMAPINIANRVFNRNNNETYKVSGAVDPSLRVPLASPATEYAPVASPVPQYAPVASPVPQYAYAPPIASSAPPMAYPVAAAADQAYAPVNIRNTIFNRNEDEQYDVSGSFPPRAPPTAAYPPLASFAPTAVPVAAAAPMYSAGAPARFAAGAPAAAMPSVNITNFVIDRNQNERYEAELSQRTSTDYGPRATPPTAYAVPPTAYAVPAPSNGVPPPAALPVPVPRAPDIHIPPQPSLEELAQSICADREFDGSRFFKEGWKFYKKNACTLIGVCLFWSLLTVLYLGAAWYAMKVFDFPASDGHNPHYDYQERQQPDQDYAEEDYGGHDFAKKYKMVKMMMQCPKLKFACNVLIPVFLLMVWSPAYSSGFAAVFKALRTNTRVSFCDFFAGFKCPYYFCLLAMTLLLLTCQYLLTWMLILPGLYWSLATAFARPLHMDHQSQIGICQSINLSIKAINRKFCSFLGFMLCLTVFNLLGLFLLGFGLLITFPVSFVAFCFAYNHLVGIVGYPVLITAAPAVTPPAVTVHV